MKHAAFGILLLSAAFVSLAAPRAQSQAQEKKPLVFQPALRVSGTVPNPPFNAIGWVEAVIDVEVSYRGTVLSTTALRGTPGGQNAVIPALKNWKFDPANDGKDPVDSHVLVAAVFRPAQLFDPAGGSPVEDLGTPGTAVPFPMATARPAYPQKRVGNRTVMVEARIDASGRIEKTIVVTEASGFDDAALEAARKWTFRPGQFKAEPVPGVAYLIFGFRAPV